MNVFKTKSLPINLRAGGESPAGLAVTLHGCGHCASTTCDYQRKEQVDHYKYSSLNNAN